MKVLEIYGDGDYCAVSFEDGIKEDQYLDLWDKAKQAGKSIDYEDESTDTYFTYEAHEFGKVDPKFINFITDLIDYDYSKSHNFYVVEE